MEKIRSAILNFINADTKKKQSATKGVLTRFANELATELGATAAREKLNQLLKELSPLPHWIMLRFSPFSFYLEGDRVFGWYDLNEQVQAEALPMVRDDDGWYVTSWLLSKDGFNWRHHGFDISEDLPVRHYADWCEVRFDVKLTKKYLPYGYALPCQLPYLWSSSGQGLVVLRSILSEGFWCAWKWWEGCQYWYLERRPELFADMDWWGDYTPPQPEPPDNPYAVVLGSRNSEYWRSVQLPTDEISDR